MLRRFGRRELTTVFWPLAAAHRLTNGTTFSFADGETNWSLHYRTGGKPDTQPHWITFSAAIGLSNGAAIGLTDGTAIDHTDHTAVGLTISAAIEHADSPAVGQPNRHVHHDTPNKVQRFQCNVLRRDGVLPRWQPQGAPMRSPDRARRVQPRWRFLHAPCPLLLWCMR